MPEPDNNERAQRDAAGSGDIVEDLLGTCLERPSEEWPEEIARACSQHPERASELRARFDGLLALLDSASGIRVGTGAAAAAAPPSRAGDDFELLERIGGGGMGVVYRARQRSLRRDVAVKRLRGERAVEESARERFRREAAVVAQLEHPGILPIHAFGEDDDGPWFAMPLHPGVSLATVLRRVAGRAPESLSGRDLLAAVIGSDRTPDDVAEVFRGSWVEACLELGVQLARALQHAHSKGALHRDVKPSNVMLDAHGQVALIDFGLTRALEAMEESLTRSGAAVGTLVYMAPEQVLARAAPTPAVDVYGLGATLSELLTLQPPYSGDSTAALEAAVLRGESAGLRVRNPRVSEDAETVVRTALARRAKDRYPSARAMGDDLERVLARRPILAERPGPFGRLTRLIARRPGASAAVVFAVAAAVGIPAGMFAVEAREKDRVTLALERALEAQRAASTARDELGRALERERLALEDAQTRALAARIAGEQSAAREVETAAVLDYFVGLFHDVRAIDVDGQEPRVKDLLRHGVKNLEEDLAQLPAVQARVRLALASALLESNAHVEALPQYELAAMALHDEGTPDARRREASALDNAHRCLALMGRHDEAIAKANEAYEVARGVLAPDDPWFPVYLASLGEAYVGSRRAAEGIGPRRQLLEHLNTYFPNDRVSIADARAGLGQALLETGRRLEAQQELEAAVVALREHAPESHGGRIRATLRLGNIPLEAGNLPRAQELFEEGLALALARYGPEDELVLGAESSLADIEQRRGDYGDACARLEKVMPRIQVGFAESRMFASAAYTYLRSLIGARRYRDAVRLADEGQWLNAFERSFGRKHPTFGGAQKAYSQCCLLTEQFEKACDALDAVAEYAGSNENLEDEELSALFAIGSLALHELKDVDRARDAFERARDIIGEDAKIMNLRPGQPPTEAGLEVRAALMGVERAAGDEALANEYEASVVARATRLGVEIK